MAQSYAFIVQSTPELTSRFMAERCESVAEPQDRLGYMAHACIPKYTDIGIELAEDRLSDDPHLVEFEVTAAHWVLVSTGMKYQSQAGYTQASAHDLCRMLMQYGTVYVTSDYHDDFEETYTAADVQARLDRQTWHRYDASADVA